MNQQSACQQLRSHLAYLNPGSAAGALPGQLEKALQEETSHTEFIKGTAADRGRGHPGAALADAHEGGQLPGQLDAGGLRLPGPARR